MSNTDMTHKNVEIEEQLNALAGICCNALDSEKAAVTDRTEALLKSLLMSGFARRAGEPLQVEIENRVKSKCQDSAMHRGGALSSISGQLQTKFDDLVRWESRQPEERAKSKAANISSATDS